MGDQTWYRGEAVGVVQAPGKTNPHDFVDGMYLTDRPDVAIKYAEMRTADPDARRVWSVKIDTSNLRILDLTTDPRWQQFIKAPAPGMPSNETFIKQANENYGRFFQNFLKKENIDLSKYDAVIGLEYLRDGRQMCVLNNERGELLKGKIRLMRVPYGARPSSMPSSVPRPGTQGGRIGTGLKIIGGTAAMLALGFLVDYIWAKVLGKMLDDEMRKLEPAIQGALAAQVKDIAETLSKGKRAFAVVNITVSDGTMGMPEGGSAPLPPKVVFNDLRISDHEEKGEGPTRTERSFRVAINHHDVTYSFETTLQPEEVDQYRAFKYELQWYDEKLQSASLVEEDVARLTIDRYALLARFYRAFAP
jgi:hypothetical protein